MKHPEIEDTREPVDIVREFNDAMEVPANDETRKLYERLIIEEAKEVREALAHLMKEMADLRYVICGHEIVGGDLEDIGDLLEAVIDIDLMMSVADAFPPELERLAFIRVHQSNMSKLGEDGKPIRREDGKVLKGPNYKPAELEDLISGPEVLH